MSDEVTQLGANGAGSRASDHNAVKSTFGGQVQRREQGQAEARELISMLGARWGDLHPRASSLPGVPNLHLTHVPAPPSPISAFRATTAIFVLLKMKCQQSSTHTIDLHSFHFPFGSLLSGYIIFRSANSKIASGGCRKAAASHIRTNHSNSAFARVEYENLARLTDDCLVPDLSSRMTIYCFVAGYPEPGYLATNKSGLLLAQQHPNSHKPFVSL